MTARHQADRKFLHATATPLAIIKLIVQKQLRDFKSGKPALTKEEHVMKLEKALKAIEEIEKLHAAHKELITERENVG